MAVCKQMLSLAKSFSTINLSSKLIIPRLKPRLSKELHTSSCRPGLMEFFDDSKNWGEREVKVGRSWKKEELRIKSNSDLHKLWYILLKEKNMLLTMEHEAKESYHAMPNPERIDKVEVSMENLEAVVRERNRAYFELEVGESGERPAREEVAFTGLRYNYKLMQHRIPEAINVRHKKYKEMCNRFDDRTAQNAFLSSFREKCWHVRRRKMNRDFNHVCGLLKRFPNMDMAAVKEKYPDVDIDRVMISARTRGHREENIY